MRLFLMVFVVGLALLSTSQAQAGCSTRCRPNIFFPERTDCYTECDTIGSVVPYMGTTSAPAGRPPARMRLVGGMAMPNKEVMDAGGNWAGMTPTTLKTEASLGRGGFFCIQAAGSPNLISMYVEMSGFSRPLTANGIALGTSSAWDLGLGVEVGSFVTDWVWLYGQVGGLMGTRDLAVSGNVPEQNDLLGNAQPLNGSNSGFGYKASLGLDVRVTSNIFLNLSWHFKPSQEIYTKDTIGSRLGVDLNSTTSIFAGGVSFHAN